MIIMMTEHSSTCTAYENMLCFLKNHSRGGVAQLDKKFLYGKLYERSKIYSNLLLKITHPQGEWA